MLILFQVAKRYYCGCANGLTCVGGSYRHYGKCYTVCSSTAECRSSQCCSNSVCKPLKKPGRGCPLKGVITTDIRHNLQVNVDPSRLSLTRSFYSRLCPKILTIRCPILISVTKCSRVSIYVRAREYEVREPIPHTWLSSNDNFQFSIRVRRLVGGDLTQQDGWKTQDGRMTKK